jgi:hypothetical protein
MVIGALDRMLSEIFAYLAGELDGGRRHALGVMAHALSERRGQR